VVFKTSPVMIKKELKSAEYDLKRAQISLREHDAKWATIQGYYAMFHAARALIYTKGYREKSHRCLAIALKELFVDQGKLPTEYFNHLKDAMDLREDADYGFIYDEESAKNIIDRADKFLGYAKGLLNV
jgi:uncharacterized protein (UPF0332 family)